MNLIGKMAFILVTGVLIASLGGCIITIIRYRYPKPNSYATGLVPAEPSSIKTPLLKSDWITWLQLALFFLLFVISLIVLCYLCFTSVLKEGPTTIEETPVAATSTPTCSPTGTPTNGSSEPVIEFHRLDEIPPIEERDGNVSYKGWGDGADLSIDGRSYTHGIGLQFTGTPFETDVSTENSPGKIYRNDCKEVSVEFALRYKYKTLVFSMGADNGDVNSFGNEETNGIAQVIFVDKTNNVILFDTGWEDYLYALYEYPLDLSNVNVLKIIYRTCGVSNEYKLKNPLRFAIVDPILVLKDDAE